MSLLNGLARLRHVLTQPTLVSTRPNEEACTATRPRQLKYAIASHAAAVAASAFSGVGKNQERSPLGGLSGLGLEDARPCQNGGSVPGLRSIWDVQPFKKVRSCFQCEETGIRPRAPFHGFNEMGFRVCP